MRGQLFVMLGASGVGKGTLREQLLAQIPMFYSVSMTTREQRPGEIDGVHYHFRTRAEFENELEQGAGFLEHAEFVGNLYGTPRAPVEVALNRGENVMLEIEVLGAIQVAQNSPHAILMFIAPPSLSELERRLRGRATESEERIQKRLLRATEEIRAARQFRYIVVNDTLEQGLLDLVAIVQAEGLKSERWSGDALEGILRS
ncbi:MAG: guanylate kinase [Pseudopedobacter sp.]|nr:guanylate kinase [Deinococcales bacterium]